LQQSFWQESEFVFIAVFPSQEIFSEDLPQAKPAVGIKKKPKVKTRINMCTFFANEIMLVIQI
jgi:hypothetical protein